MKKISNPALNHPSVLAIRSSNGELSFQFLYVNVNDVLKEIYSLYPLKTTRSTETPVELLMRKGKYLCRLHLYIH